MADTTVYKNNLDSNITKDGQLMREICKQFNIKIDRDYNYKINICTTKLKRR